MEYNISQFQIETRAFIGGRYVLSADDQFIEKYSSVTGKKLPSIVSCGQEEVNSAVKAAREAFKEGVWSRLDVKDRQRIMFRFAALMEEHLEEIATLDAYETGRAFQNYVYDSIPKAIEAIRYFAEAVDKIYDKSVFPGQQDFCMIKREALGVVGIITPWNDPMVVAAWKFSPALLMGNSVVMKPAEQSSLSLIRVAALAKEAGIPDGVFNVVPGYGETAGKALALHPDVAGIFFTGSSEVGKLLIQYAGQSNMKKVALECGGKGPYIVTPHYSDLQEAAEVLAKNMFYNQGQICSAPSRVIIHTSVKEAFLQYLYEAAEQYVPQDPYNIANKVGCVVSKEQYDRIMRYIDLAKQEKTEIRMAQSPSNLPKGACGIRPTVISGVSSESVLLKEEIFGPVVCIQEYETPEEAVAMANDTVYGLAGAVWSSDLNELHYYADRIKVGLLHINSYGDDDNSSPFGGFGQSGNGKDKSVYAFDEYSEVKSIWIRVHQ